MSLVRIGRNNSKWPKPRVLAAALLAACQIVGGFQQPEGGAGGGSGGVGGSAPHPCAPLERKKVSAVDDAVLTLSFSADSCFWIDEDEVTVAQYRLFLEASAPEWEPERCGWKGMSDPSDPTLAEDACGSTIEGQGDAFADDKPIRCVDWCDAAAYCDWVDRRLCEDAIVAFGAQEPTNTVDEFGAACALGETLFPWGNDPDVDRCNVGQTPAGSCQHGTLFDCGPVPGGEYDDCRYDDGAGPKDMIGNVTEWPRTCAVAEVGAASACERRGGSYATPAPQATCQFRGNSARRDTRAADTGFRCCVDLTGGEEGQKL